MKLITATTFLVFSFFFIQSCAPIKDVENRLKNNFDPHQIDGAIYRLVEIGKLQDKTINELNNYTKVSNLKWLKVSVNDDTKNLFEDSINRSETPKELKPIFETVLTEIFDGTEHSIYHTQIAKCGNASTMQTNENKVPVDLTISGNYNWYEKDLDIRSWSSSLIFTTDAQLDTEIGNYTSRSQAQVNVTIRNCATQKQKTVRERVDIFQRASDDSIYLFSKQFGVVFLNRKKQRGSVNVALEEALKVALLKALLLATGKSFDDIESYFIEGHCLKNAENDANLIKSIQKHLLKLGYFGTNLPDNHHIVDGLFGHNTQKALSQFTKDVFNWKNVNCITEPALRKMYLYEEYIKNNKVLE